MAKKLKLKIHNKHNTTIKRLRFVELAREKLRREHNMEGVRFRNGQITEAEWEEYKANTFGPRNFAVSQSLISVRDEIKNEVRSLPDDDSDLVDLNPTDLFEDE